VGGTAISAIIPPVAMSSVRNCQATASQRWAAIWIY